MPKNLVICCDGTGNEFGDSNSNVVKLYSLLDNSSQQMTYYHPGLGTMGSRFALTKLSRWWTKIIGLAFGYGLMDNLTDAYVFLMHEYEDGDSVFLFGFSRGAYTARALAAMLNMFGLIRKGNESLVPYAIRLFKSKIRNQHSFDIAHRFKATFSAECKPHFVGVWDTVSSVGWVYDPLNLPYTAHNPDIAIGRHALSIDERRCAFRQNLWVPQVGQDSKQVWFAGVHSDVGGGYAEDGLSNITLQWMVRESTQAGLLLKTDQSLSVGGASANAPEDALAAMHNSMTIWWRPIEILPRSYIDMRCQPPRRRWRIPLCARRWIAHGSILHSSVEKRMKAGYNPPNLPKNPRFEY